MTDSSLTPRDLEVAAKARAAALKEAAGIAEAEHAECCRVVLLHPEDSESRDRMFARARTAEAIKDAILSLATAPRGYVVVPVEPTPAMKGAGAIAVVDGGVGDFGRHDCITMSARLNEAEAGIVYRAMITATTGGKE
jgi:hypothetical protein